MNDEPAVLTERRERVLLITINRPDQRNAVNAAVAHGIAAALEPVRRFGVQPQPLGRAPHPRRRKVRALEQEPRRRRAHFAGAAAHDAADADRLALGVGDDHVVGRERALLIVERDDPFARLGATHDEPAGDEDTDRLSDIERAGDAENRVTATGA